MYIAIDCKPSCDVMNFEINLTFLIKPFFYMTRKLRQKFKYLKNKKSFQCEIKKTFFINFKGISIPKNCLRRESAPLKKSLVVEHD